MIELLPLRILAFVAGWAIVLRTMGSTVRVFVVPRGIPDPLVRWLLLRMRHIFSQMARRVDTYERIDGIWAFFGPVGLLALLVVWELLVAVGFLLMFLAVDPGGGSWQDLLRRTVTITGSSLM